VAILRVTRFNYGPELPSSVAGTFGTMELPSGHKLYSVEPPWVGNKQSVSCIPEGIYKLRYRNSGVVSRSTSGEFTGGWEITDVPNRTFIMIHPGNWPQDFKGCVGPGITYHLLKDRTGTLRLGVTSSRDAFRVMMSELPVNEDHEIHIVPHLISHP
jgi:hypothetical protein